MVERCYLCGGKSFRKREGKVRDSDNLDVLECENCGLVFLSSFDHIKDGFYESSGMLNGKVDLQKYRKDTLKDDERRFNYLNEFITNRKLLDFGCGAGGFLLKSSEITSQIAGIELDNTLRNALINENINCYYSLEEVTDKYDVITMFHVLEHLQDPIKTLRELANNLDKNGSIIIEVPSSDDALLTLYKSKAFSEFTYWSCHLYLFNPSTLKLVAEKSGYKVEYIKQVQRYPLSNHLYWLANEKPGGHELLSYLNNKELHSQYENVLASIGKCDTLLASITPV